GIPRFARDDKLATSSAVSVFDDPRAFRSRDPVIRGRAGLLDLPALESELGAVAGGVLVRQGVDRRGGRDGDLHPREVRPRLAGFEQDRARSVERDLVAGGEVFGLRQKHERQPRLFVLRQLPNRELLVLGREEPALAGVVREHLLLRRGVVEPETLRRLDPDRAGLALSAGKT